MPKKLLWNETFEDSMAFRATWKGAGEWLKEGLSYSKETALATSPGAYRTSGIDFSGCRHMIAADLLPADGVLYVSFLMRMPEYLQRDKPFAGLTFYQEDEETLFVGKVTPRRSFGVRVRPARSEFFGVRPDGETHLFVIRIDRTRLVTDVFIDPVPGQLEATHQPSHRLHEAPVFDRVVMRSGSEGGPVQVDFDEIRFGLTWESVLPVAR